MKSSRRKIQDGSLSLLEAVRRAALEKQQAGAWGRKARDYEHLFVQPFAPDVYNPLLFELERIPRPKSVRVADMGCGKGELVEILARRFRHITAIDFSPKMLSAARRRLKGNGNIRFMRASMMDLSGFRETFNIITATSSIVMPDPLDRDQAFRELYLALKPGGRLLAIVPSMDAVFYHASLLFHAHRIAGKDEATARAEALSEVEASIFDCALGLFHWEGIRQKFYHPFEIQEHLKRAGFIRAKLAKVEYPWGHAADPIDAFPRAAPLWDWFFSARKP